MAARNAVPVNFWQSVQCHQESGRAQSSETPGLGSRTGETERPAQLDNRWRGL
jgi:hypothetical protein